MEHYFRKDGYDLFNDLLSTFLFMDMTYDSGHMVQDHPYDENRYLLSLLVGLLIPMIRSGQV